MDRNVEEGPPNAHTPQGVLWPESDPYEVWREKNPCPDDRLDCPRCYIDYAGYLATEEILNVTDAQAMG